MDERGKHDPVNYSDALSDPAACFSSPEELIATDNLSVSQKIELLRRWAYDADEVAVAEEEGMTGGRPPMLQRILFALETLGAEFDTDRTPPTKQGGLAE